MNCGSADRARVGVDGPAMLRARLPVRGPVRYTELALIYLLSDVQYQGRTRQQHHLINVDRQRDHRDRGRRVLSALDDHHHNRLS